MTNTVSCGLMMAAGDVLQQRNEYLRKHKCLPTRTYVMAASPHAEQKFHNSKDSDKYMHDYVRTKNMTIVGLLQGPFHHWFYMILDRVVPGKTVLSVIKKTCLDQSIASPTCLGIFFIGLGLLEHRTMEEIREEMKLKLYDTWKVHIYIYIYIYTYTYTHFAFPNYYYISFMAHSSYICIITIISFLFYLCSGWLLLLASNTVH